MVWRRIGARALEDRLSFAGHSPLEAQLTKVNHRYHIPEGSKDARWLAKTYIQDKQQKHPLYGAAKQAVERKAQRLADIMDTYKTSIGASNTPNADLRDLLHADSQDQRRLEDIATRFGVTTKTAASYLDEIQEQLAYNTNTSLLKEHASAYKDARASTLKRRVRHGLAAAYLIGAQLLNPITATTNSDAIAHDAHTQTIEYAQQRQVDQIFLAGHERFLEAYQSLLETVPQRMSSQERLAYVKGKFGPLINYARHKTLKETGVDVPQHLMEALIDWESGGNNLAVSTTGCAGLVQFNSQTPKLYGLESIDYKPRIPHDIQTKQQIREHGNTMALLDAENRFDPLLSIVAHTRNMADLYSLTGSWEQALKVNYAGYLEEHQAKGKRYAKALLRHAQATKDLAPLHQDRPWMLGSISGISSLYDWRTKRYEQDTQRYADLTTAQPSYRTLKRSTNSS